jgi:hypothetical protein
LDDPYSSSYSVGISKYKGSDPGPLADYYQTTFYFGDIKPGKWYINVKKNLGRYWSNQIWSWEVNVPQWVQPSLTPIPTIIIAPTNQNTQSNDNSATYIVGLLVLLAMGGYISNKIK